jgi:hypothetical protein
MTSIFTSNAIRNLFFTYLIGFCCLSNAQDVLIKRGDTLKIDQNALSLFELEKGEKIEYSKSLYWEANQKKYAFLAVSYKKTQGCRFIFIKLGETAIISDGAFNFEHCTFTKEPELLDINNDGKIDFKVWMKLPHHVGSNVMVLHNLDFIFDSSKGMFCESNSGIPCNIISIP